MFCDGGDKHPLFNKDRLVLVEKLNAAGVGLVVLHLVDDVPKDLGDRTRQLLGAAWEKGFWERANWVTTFSTFPSHPISRGVTPFTKISQEAPVFRHGDEWCGVLSMNLLDPAFDIVYHKCVKLTLQIQLFPDREHAACLKATVERFNEAADWLAGEAFEIKVANKIQLQKTHYATVREKFGLSAKMTVRCIARVCEAYKPDKAKRPHFRKHAAMPFDQPMMGFKGVDRASLLTLEGRVLVPFLMGKYQVERFTNAKGQADLVLRKDGKWFLLVTVDVPEWATIPRKHNLQRKRLGKRNTKGAKKKLKRIAGKEARFRKHTLANEVVF
jgi:predicted transposase